MSENMSTSFPTQGLAEQAAAFGLQLKNLKHLQAVETPQKTIESILNMSKRSSQVSDNIDHHSEILTFQSCNSKKEKMAPMAVIIKISDREWMVLIVGVESGIVQITPDSISECLPTNPI